MEVGHLAKGFMTQGNVVMEKSVEFAVEIVGYCESLIAQRRFVISDQLLKSGTSIGANVYEAQHAESRADFIHKMKIALKEANETVYWLLICEKAGYNLTNSSLKNKAEELIRILSKIIVSSKANA